MPDTLLPSLSLIDASGYLIIATILTFLAAGCALTFALRRRYVRMAGDLRQGARAGAHASFQSPVLNRIVREAREAARLNPGNSNTQVIVESAFHSELKGLLIGERFVKSSTGLMIILGLVGTFYGLTLSIGELAALLSSEVDDATAITESLTAGLTQALTGMSVAFSTSLFGILAAIVMSLLGVFFSVADRRTALMAEIEGYVDNVLLLGVGGSAPERLDRMVTAFGHTVERLDGTVAHFESALQTFATTTRDFREFNLHLKDNVQRMSLSFGDLSETLKAHAGAFKPRG